MSYYDELLDYYDQLDRYFDSVDDTDTDYYNNYYDELDKYTVTEFIKLCNDYLKDEFYRPAIIEGEVSEFKISQNKWAFFSLKDQKSTLNCFLPVWKLNVELTDGMRIRIKGRPKITDWGKFSFTVEQIAPLGQGSIKKAFDLLKLKLQREGLFDPDRKRSLTFQPTRIGVISSTDSAGYADFCKIINARWGGLEIRTCHTQVQGMDAPAQIIRALNYLNERAEVEVIAIIRGGGSKDDLSCFNDELLARAIASSRIPVITGIGHEIDESIADLVADMHASTPSNCAELLTRDRRAELLHVKQGYLQLGFFIKNRIDNYVAEAESIRQDLCHQIAQRFDSYDQKLDSLRRTLEACSPEKVLSQGYAILRGKVSPGQELQIITKTQIAQAKIINVTPRKGSQL